MIGKVIDINSTEAFITFQDGTLMDIGIAHLPQNSKIGDNVNIQLGSISMTNHKMNELF